MRIAKVFLQSLFLAALGVLGPVLLLADESPVDPDAVLGIWETPHEEDGWSRIEIYQCEDKYCGRIVWLNEPLYPADDDEDMAGQPKVDRKNPDESLRSRSIQGLELMHSFVFDGKHTWKDGRIYDPKSGKTYRCKMEISEDGILKVRGYVKVGFVKLGRTSEWTPVTEPATD